MGLYVTQETVQTFYERLQGEGKSAETVRKYQRDLSKLGEFLDGDELTQEKLEEYKIWLVERKEYKARSANSYLACANHFCRLMGQNFHVTAYKLGRVEQGALTGLLSAEEYERLAKTAVQRRDSMTALVMQILSMTDIRVTELFRITVESLETGSIRVPRGSEEVEISLPAGILTDLRKYAGCRGYQGGAVFRTSRGNPVDRFQLWKKLKRLCRDAGVNEEKVSFQSLKKPLSREYYPVED